MSAIVSALLRYFFSWLCPKHELALENLALRHQIAVLNRHAPKPKLQGKDRLLWLVLKGWWPNWRTALIIFQPETVIGWQRAGFRMFWRWKSRHRGGRPRKDSALIQLIRRMWAVNPTWGSPRIRDELAKLGLEASTATIRKYRPKSRRPSSQSWRTFLQNHAGALAALDFFVVPTVTFRLLYVLLVITHARRKVVHFNITEEPTAEWTAQQVVNAFPYDTAPKYLVRDRDSIYGSVFVQRLEGMGIQQKLISPRSPWQSPYVERLVGSIRRECLDRVIVFHERQLRQLLESYLEYYHNVRPHRSLDHDSPVPRPVQSADCGKVIELPLVGGLHHRYLRQAA
ncbi:MAG: integrase core domain-containing protein [Verrucomicrobiota bacterium]|jgi:transposase InsO family protein